MDNTGTAVEEHDSIRVVREWADALNAHDLDRLAHLYAPGHEAHDISRDLAFHGFREVRSDLEEWMQAFPDLQIQIDRVIQQERSVCAGWTFNGTHARPFLRIPATRRRVSIIGFSFLEIQRGRIVAAQHLWDLSGMLRTMRLLPELPLRSTGWSPLR